MSNRSLLYCATDKEVYDVLMSSKQHFSETALLELARGRGILLSPSDDREDLADRLAVMIFGYHEIRAIQAEFERSGRGEKTTSFRLNGKITAADIKEAAIGYGGTVGEEESVVSYGAGPTAVAVDLKYTETDFSKTRLRQRQTREARIEFKVEDGYTIVTLPASDKARAVADAIRVQLRSKQPTDLGIEEVDLSEISDPFTRSAFFTRLISRLPDMRLQNVTRVKVDRADKPEAVLDDDASEEDNGSEDASAEMLGIVRAVALHGEDLLSSKEYQSLHKRGFFITSITWSCRRTVSSYQQVEFDAGFDDPTRGVGFKYSVRGWATQKEGEYTKSFRPMPLDDKRGFLVAIESTAIGVFRELRKEIGAREDDGPSGGGPE
jgi:hypothetical protein